MALRMPQAPGFGSMLKDGSRHFSGLDEAVYRNISACKEFAETVRSAYGPNGMNKMVINHIDKLFVTNDAATIIKELDVEHPAAKIMIMASEMQEEEIGDGTNFVIVLAGALLEGAEELLRMGLTPAEVVEGYELALDKALEILPKLSCGSVKNYRDKEEVVKGIKSCVMSKQLGYEDFLSGLIAKACVAILPEKTTFNVDNIRICKIMGGSLLKSEIVHGMVFKKQLEGIVTKTEKAKVAVYTCPVDITQTETKGTVLIKSADELKKFSHGEESQLENQIKSIADSGATVVVSGGKIGDMALHFLNKYNLMAVRLHSKFDIRRLCKSVGATALPQVSAPTIEDLGYADKVYVDELGDTNVVVFQLEGKESRIATIVLRGATDNLLDDMERAIDDGVNSFKALTKDARYVAGGGATEIELARQVTAYGETCPGLEQYSIKKFAEALEIFPKLLAENSGVKANEVLAKLYASHQEGNVYAGFSVEGDGKVVDDAAKAEIVDLYLTKYWGLKYATNAACTILKVDQIIMAKRAGGPQGGPKPPSPDED